MGRKYRDFPYHCCFPHIQRVSNYQYPTPKWHTCCLSLFSCLGLSDSSWPHGLQHIGHPCPSLFAELAQTYVHWVGDAIQPSCSLSSPTVPFSSCLQSFPASGSFVISQLFKSGDQSIGASASASVPPMNIRDWFPLGLTGLILQSTGLSRVFSNTTVQNHQLFSAQPSLWSNSHIHTWLPEKPQPWPDRPCYVTLVTISESPLRHNNYPMFIICIRVQLNVVHSVHLNKHVITWNQRYSLKQSIFMALTDWKILCTLPVRLCLPTNKWQPLIFFQIGFFHLCVSCSVMSDCLQSHEL